MALCNEIASNKITSSERLIELLIEFFLMMLISNYLQNLISVFLENDLKRFRSARKKVPSETCFLRWCFNYIYIYILAIS